MSLRRIKKSFRQGTKVILKTVDIVRIRVYMKTIVSGSQLNSVRPARAGVIPYTVVQNRIYLLLGVDRRTRELTDFGGGCKANETAIDAAWRELQEESCKLFENLEQKALEQSVAVMTKDQQAVIFFMKISTELLTDTQEKFKRKQEQLQDYKKHLELIGVKWVEDTYFKVIGYDRNNHCLWKRIQNILRWNSDWDDLRSQLLNSTGDQSTLADTPRDRFTPRWGQPLYGMA